jgi:hemolysin III
MPESAPAREAKEEEFSLPLFALTVVLSLVALFAGIRFAAPAVWEAQFASSAWKALTAFLAVSMVTCFIEFFFHRYVLHLPAIPGFGRLYRQHTLHHALTRIGRGTMRNGRRIMVVENKFPILGPEQKEGSFFPWYAMIGFTVLMLPLLLVLNWLLPSFPWLAVGFLTIALSLTIYEVWHAINHWPLDVWLPLMEHRVWGGFWRTIYSFHLRHHAVIDCNESVSGFLGLPVADWVFGTCVLPRTIYADGEEWRSENFVAPRPRTLIRWLDRLALNAIQERRRDAAAVPSRLAPPARISTVGQGTRS